MPAEHSSWSASGFEQVMLCPGSKALQKGLPNPSSQYAAEGTAAHQVLTWALQGGRDAAAYLGRTLEVEGWTFEVDDEMVEAVQVCIDYTRKIAVEGGGLILVDQRVHYHAYLDLPKDEAWGTLDVAVALPGRLVVIDFKYGKGVLVEAGCSLEDGHGSVVDVHPNPQLALYGLGGLDAMQDVVEHFDDVLLVICQPRTSVTPSTYLLTVEQLEAWGRSTARSAVATARNAIDGAPETGVAPEEWQAVYIRPGDKQCRFCRAKAFCPALQDEVQDAITVAAEPGDFELVDDLPAATLSKPERVGLALAKVDLIEAWCTAIRAEAERLLLAGENVPGFKLVQGKRGNRKWVDAKQAEEMLREQFRLPIEKAYDLKLISPTTAEKLAKAGDIGKRQWPKLQALITQTDGKPSVAPVSDSRPALTVTPVVDDFNDVTVESLA